MANTVSTIAALQVTAQSKGPGRGSPSPQAAAVLRILDDKATLAIGAPLLTAASGEYVKFGKVPKGAIIYPNLIRLTTTHTAEVAGKITLLPLSGAAGTDIAGVTAKLETLAVAHDPTSMNVVPDSGLDCVDSQVVAEDSWVCFLPTSDLTIASSAKAIWLRLVYGTTY